MSVYFSEHVLFARKNSRYDSGVERKAVKYEWKEDKKARRAILLVTDLINDWRLCMQKSARQLGKELGLSDREMNQLLKNEGFITGKPNNWSVTEKGKAYAELEDRRSGVGGFQQYNPTWTITTYDDSILDSIEITEEKLKAAREASVEATRAAREEREQKQQEYYDRMQTQALIEADQHCLNEKVALIGAGTLGAGFLLYKVWEYWPEIKFKWLLFKTRFLRRQNKPVS